jgi:hypothetical protein
MTRRVTVGYMAKGKAISMRQENKKIPETKRN